MHSGMHSGPYTGEPDRDFVVMVDSLTKPDGSRIALTKFTANPSGAAVAQAIGPLRTVVGGNDGAAGKQSEQRYLVVTAIGSEQPVLQQQTP
jgi:hypothetical protein